MKTLGYIGILLIQCSYWTQIYRVVADRRTTGLSPVFIFMIWLGLICLQAYSYHIQDMVYIISNWIGLANTSILMILFFMDEKI